jgi:hypothetical protein
MNLTYLSVCHTHVSCGNDYDKGFANQPGCDVVLSEPCETFWVLLCGVRAAGVSWFRGINEKRAVSRKAALRVRHHWTKLPF